MCSPMIDCQSEGIQYIGLQGQSGDQVLVAQNNFDDLTGNEARGLGICEVVLRCKPMYHHLPTTIRMSHFLD